MREATVLQRENAGKSHGRHLSVAQQARALAIILREEFDTPFTLFDAATGAALEGREAGPDLRREAVLEVAADGRARVTRLPDGSFRLALVLYQGARAVLVGVGEVSALA